MTFAAAAAQRAQSAGVGPEAPAAHRLLFHLPGNRSSL
jgi:hypothetical protein